MNAHNASTDLAYRLIRRAARRAPEALAERLEEEWLADLGSRRGALARLRLAVGCWWASAVILRDLRVPQLAASAVAASAKSIAGSARYDLPLLSRRTVVFILIAALHVLLIYAFSRGFAQHVFALNPTQMHGVIIEEARPQPPPLPRVTREFKPSQLHDQRPEYVDPGKFNFPGADEDAAQGTGQARAAPADPAVAPRSVRLVGGPGRGFPATDDYYPSLSRRLSETGVANVQVCVDSRGNLTADPTLAKSSGIARIDAAALNLAKAGSGHYRPSTENGAPVNSCYPFRIRFELKG
jgi:TonB family protein